MTVYNILKLLHIIAAVVFAGGLFARQVVRGYARKTDDINWYVNLSKAASHVENVMIKPGSIVILVLGIIQARLGGIPIFGILSGESQNWLFVSLLLYFATFALVPLVFVPKGRAFRPVLEAAQAQGRITPDLRAAMNDPVVALAHRFEEGTTLVVIALMVLKPF